MRTGRTQVIGHREVRSRIALYFPGKMPQPSPNAFCGTNIEAETDCIGKYRRNAQILSIHGINRFNSALHNAPLLQLSEESEGCFVLWAM